MYSPEPQKEQALHWRSLLAVQFADTYWPASGQVEQSVESQDEKTR